MSKFESLPVTKKFLETHQTHLNDDKRIVAGVSGGPDSMALLYLLHRTGTQTTVVHCNYGLRGKDSEKDQELVEEMCSLWEIECISVRLQQESGNRNNFQNWAREERYRIFEDIKREYKADYIATAHHRNDQIETILQKILRGGGVSSWKGMHVIEGELYRPLLNVTRQEIMSFVQQMNIPFRMDGSNEESTYARNFLRQNWFPELNRLFPGWKDNLMKISSRAEEFEAMADALLSDCREKHNSLKWECFQALSVTVRPVVMHRFLEQSGYQQSISGGFLELAKELENLKTGSRLQVSEHLYLERDRDYLILVPVETRSIESRKVVFQKENLVSGFKTDGLEFVLEPFEGTYPEGVLKLDSESVQYPLTLRNWNDGDSFTPLGMTGSQLISDHLTNRKISSVQKHEAKVLNSFDGTILAVIFPHETSDGQIGTLSEHVRCSEQTKTTVSIRKS